MGVILIPQNNTTNPVVEAIIQTTLPESLLRVGATYLTGTSYSKTLTYKGKTYTPGNLMLVTVNANELVFLPVPANYVFTVGGKTFKVNADRSRIGIIAGGEPILWRLIKTIQSTDPADTSPAFLPTEQGIVTNGIAPTKFSYFYKVNDIYQSEPLQDGVIFRYIEPGSGAITWRKFAVAGEGGIFENFGGTPEATIASINNIDFANLSDLNAIVNALDTVDDKPFTAAIFGRDGKQMIDMSILVNGQIDKRQNGLYYFSCVQGDLDLSSAVRVSPFLQYSIANIGRARVLVWKGDRFGEDEAWIKSDAPIGATSSAPRISIGTTPQYWVKSKPQISVEQQLASALEKVDSFTETDPVATEQVKTLETKVTDLATTVDTLPTTAIIDAVKTSVTTLQTDLTALDKSKASAESVTALDTSVKDLDTALKALAALPPDVSQAELDAAIAAYEAADKAVNTAIDGVKATADTAKAALDKAIADLKKLQTIESSNPPDFDDPNWAVWIQRVYDYSALSGTARAWLRTPNTNDGLPFPNSWTETVTPPTLADAKPDPSRVDLLALELPQGVRFRFPTTVPLNSSLSCDISFPAGVFTGISYQLADENKAIIPKTPKGQMVTETDRAAGIGWASVPNNAKFAQFNFAYKNGGNLPFEFPITIS
jgi:hypothetical protein